MALAACAPPPELDRPVTPPDARAPELLPPGRASESGGLLTGALDSALVEHADGGRMAAFRFASGDEVRARFAEIGRVIAACRGAGSRSSMRAGDAVYLRCSQSGVSVLAWTSGMWVFVAEAPDSEKLTALVAASRAGGLGADLVSFLRIGYPLSVLGALLLISLAICAAMALALRTAAVKPRAGVMPVTRPELVARLLALDSPTVPFMLRLEPSGEVVAEWKYADAAWWGIMAKAGVRKSYRLHLRFDEERHVVKALDEFGTVEWSAGGMIAPKIRYRRTSFRGVALFQRERGVTYGFWTPTGRGFGKVLDYRFNMAELKGPVTETAVAAGWRFQPVLW